jgi:hypothetical protein
MLRLAVVLRVRRRLLLLLHVLLLLRRRRRTASRSVGGVPVQLCAPPINHPPRL